VLALCHGKIKASGGWLAYSPVAAVSETKGTLFDLVFQTGHTILSPEYHGL
jgi:hypothetical protein